MGFLSILSFAQKLVLERVKPGDAVIDATVGNGNDTLFLARSVGSHGIAYGFDIQQSALENAKVKFVEAGFEHIQLFERSHAEMAEVVPDELHGKIAAVMFNLGYLPGGDRNITTIPETTLGGLNASISLLKKGGILTAVLYSGHEGGAEEAETVVDWAAKLPQSHYQVLSYRFLNQVNDPPYLIAVEKR